MPLQRTAFSKLHRIFLSSAVLILSCAAGAKLATLSSDDPGLLQADRLLGIQQRDLLLGAGVVELVIVGSVIRLRGSFQSVAILAWCSSLLGLYRLGSWWVGSQGCACFGRITGKSPLLAAFFEGFALSSLAYLLIGSFALLWIHYREASQGQRDVGAEGGEDARCQRIVGAASRTKLLLAAALLHVGNSAIAADSTADKSISEQFKAFLANSPPIESVVFSQRGMTHATKGTISGLYHACWQSNAFVVQPIRHPDDLKQPGARPVKGFLHGRYGHLHWRVQPNIGPSTTSILFADVGAVPASVANNYRTALGTDSAQSLLASTVLHLGLPGISPWTLRWNGNEFEAPTIDGDRVRGWLEPDVRDRPWRLHAEREKSSGYRTLFEYHYQEVIGPDFIPNVIDCSIIIPPEKQTSQARWVIAQDRHHEWGQGRPFTNTTRRIQFLAMKLAAEPMAQAHFMPDRLLKWNNDKRITGYYTNQWLYTEDRGRLHPAPKALDEWTRPTRTKFLIAAIVTSAFFLPILWRMKKQQNKRITKGTT